MTVFRSLVARVTTLSSSDIRHSTYAIVGHDGALRKSLGVNVRQLLSEVFSVQAAANYILAAMKRVD